MRSSQWGRTQRIRGTTPIKLAKALDKKIPADDATGTQSQPHSLRYGPHGADDIFCPDNGGSSGTGYSDHFRPATQRTIRRRHTGKALSNPCSLYRWYSAYSSSSQSLYNSRYYTWYSRFVNSRNGAAPAVGKYNSGPSTGSWWNRYQHPTGAHFHLRRGVDPTWFAPRAGPQPGQNW